MSRIVVTSRVPGFRRAGIEHPARKVYEAGQLTEKQLDAIRAEPNLTVMVEGESATSGIFVLTELRAAVGAAIEAGVSLDAFMISIAGFIAREWNTQGASGTAREASSAGSGDQASEAGDGPADEGAGSGIQSAPPPTILADQQPEHSSVGKAEPEAEIAVQHGNEAAQTSGEADGSHADDGGSQSEASETGEAGESGSAAAAPAADNTSTEGETAPAASAKPAKPARTRK